jgi:hypothetical protein
MKKFFSCAVLCASIVLGRAAVYPSSPAFGPLQLSSNAIAFYQNLATNISGGAGFWPDNFGNVWLNQQSLPNAVNFGGAGAQTLIYGATNNGPHLIATLPTVTAIVFGSGTSGGAAFYSITTNAGAVVDNIGAAANLIGTFTPTGFASPYVVPTGGTNLFKFWNCPRNTNIVYVAPYFYAIQGAANFGPTHNETSFRMINTNNPTRIRQAGNITGANVYLPSTNGLTNLIVELWKLNGTNYDCFAQSSPLWPIVPLQTNTFIFSTVLSNAQEGDFYGFFAQFSAATTQNFFGTNGAGTYGSQLTTNAAGGLSVTNTAGTTLTNMVWSTNVVQVLTVPIQLLAQAPQAVAYGASLTSGRVGTESFADIGQSAINPQIAWPSVLFKSLGVTYQNMGQSGDRNDLPDGIAVPNWRFTNDIIGLHPSFIVDGGDALRNAIAATPAATNSTLLGYVTNELYTCISNGIPLVMASTMPTIGASGWNATLASNADFCDNQLALMAANWPNQFIFVDLRKAIGITCTTAGPPNNLWTLSPAYDSGDGVHLHAPGWRIVASTVLSNITPTTIMGGLVVGDLGIRSGNIRFDGWGGTMGTTPGNTLGAGQYIDGGQQQQYMQPGAPFAINGQAAYPGSTNQAGGELYLLGGLPTGNGTNGVSMVVANISPSTNSFGTNAYGVRTAFIGTNMTLGIYGPSNNLIQVAFYTNNPSGSFQAFNQSWNRAGSVGLDPTNNLGLFGPASSGSPALYVGSTDSRAHFPNTFYADNGIISGSTVTISNGGGLTLSSGTINANGNANFNNGAVFNAALKNFGGYFATITNIGGSYTVQSSDCTIICTNTGVETITLPQWYSFQQPESFNFDIFKPGQNTNGITIAMPSGGTNGLNLTLGGFTVTNGPVWIKFRLQGGSTNGWYHILTSPAGLL